VDHRQNGIAERNGHLFLLMADDVQVTETSSYQEVIDILTKNQPFDLLLMDLSMPGMRPEEGLARLCDSRPIFFD